MKTLIKLFIAHAIFFTNNVSSQSFVGNVINFGAKKNLVTLTEINGTKNAEVKANFSPVLGYGYHFLVNRKINVSGEVDFSSVKLSLFEDVMEVNDGFFGTDTTFTRQEIINKAPISWSIRVLGHYTFGNNFQASFGGAYQRLPWGLFDINEIIDGSSDSPFKNQFDEDLTVNICMAAGLSFFTEKFRLDLRYENGFLNYMRSSNPETDLYRKLKIGAVSLTAGFQFGS